MTCDKSQYTLFFLLGDPPDIDEGPYVPMPSTVTQDPQTIKIGTPVYTHSGFVGSTPAITINCSIVSGNRPVTFTWYLNGSRDTSRGNVTSITINNARDNDVIMCRADNDIGFDEEMTNIRGTYVYTYMKFMYVHTSYSLIAYVLAT